MPRLKRAISLATLGFMLLLITTIPSSTVLADTTIVEVDSTFQVGRFNSLELNSNDFAVATYHKDAYTGSPPEMRLAVCNDAICSAPTITLFQGADFYSDVKLDRNDIPIATYFDGSLKLVVCHDVLCSSSTTTDVTSDGNNIDEISLELNRDGIPVIAYEDFTASVVKIVVCDDVLCTSSTTRRIREDNWRKTRNYISLALTSTDFPVISYISSGDELRLAICHDLTCQSVTYRTIDEPGNIGRYTSVEVNSRDLPVISYSNSVVYADLKLAVCNDAICSAPTITTVDDGDRVGWYNSLELTSDDVPVISYTSPSGLTLAACNDALCSAPTITTLSSGGPDNSLELTDNGFPVLSMYRYGLKLVLCDTPTCTQTGTIVIDKVTNISTSTQPFNFTDDIAPPNSFSLTNSDAPQVFRDLAPGTYTVTELDTPGWLLGDLVCTDPDNGSTVDIASGVATIDVDAGEIVNCTFTNNQIGVTPTATLTPTPTFTLTPSSTPTATLTPSPTFTPSLPPPSPTLTPIPIETPLPECAAVNLTSRAGVDIAGMGFDENIDGDYAVWYSRDGANDIVNLYQISTDTTTPIFQRVAATTAESTMPGISGNHVVWQWFDGTDYDIYGYDIATSTLINITQDSTDEDVFANLDGDHVIWRKTFGDGSGIDLHLYDFSTGQTTNLTNDPSYDGYAVISGDYAVWDSTVYQFSTGTKTEVTLPGTFTDYSVDGNYVAWGVNNGGDFAIYLYTISTGALTHISDQAGHGANVYLRGDYLVWNGQDPSTSDYTGVYLYQISTGTTTYIADLNLDSGFYSHVMTDGSVVIWQSMIGGFYETFMYDIATGELINISNANSGHNLWAQADGNYVVWHWDNGSEYEMYLYALNCEYPPQPTPTPTYTHTPTPTYTPTPTATHTPSLTPTPTPVPTATLPPIHTVNVGERTLFAAIESEIATNSTIEWIDFALVDLVAPGGDQPGGMNLTIRLNDGRVGQVFVALHYENGLVIAQIPEAAPDATDAPGQMAFSEAVNLDLPTLLADSLNTLLGDYREIVSLSMTNDGLVIEVRE